MHKRILLLLIGTLSMVAVSTHANDIEPGKEYYSVLRAQNPIVLDGNLSEWTGIPVLADPRFYIRTGFEGSGQGKGSGGTNATLFLFERCDACIAGTPDWTGPDDQTSAVQIAYDNDNVYFGFVVTDDYHENAANSAWNGDSVQLMIASADRTTQVALYNYALGGIEGAIGSTIVEHEAGPGGTEAVITRNATTKRTTYEIKLPKASLGLANLTLGTTEGLVTFGLGMAINDGDEAAPGQGGWGGLGAHAIVFGKTPSETALMTLVRPNDIEPGKQAYTAAPLPSPFVLDGNLSEWTGVPVLADPKFYIRTGFEGTAQGKGSAGTNATLFLFERCDACIAGTPDYTGPDDQTSAVQIAFDADNVYFGFVVTDEYHENAANNAWNGDSIQLMIASPNLATQVALYNYALGGVEGAIGAVVTADRHEAGPGGDPACNCPTDVFITRNATTKRTTYEIKLPKASLGLSNLAFGTQFGLGMAINDGDEVAAGQGGWGGLGAHSIVFGKTPSETAFITLGTAVATADRLFFSAINPTIDTFTFRANDKGPSIVDPTTARLIIDGVTNTPVASPRVLDAVDFTYTPSPPFAGNREHSYVIVVRDTLGNTVTSAGTFVTPAYALLTAADKVTADTAQTGFILRLHQNSQFTINSIARAQQQLAGLLGENFANSAVAGPSIGDGTPGSTVNDPYTFEIEGVINLDEAAGASGDFTPDQQMPGIPGFDAAPTDGIAGEFTTYVELPAGRYTMIVNSDDNFRTTAGNIDDVFGAQVAGEFNDPTGRAAADTAMSIRVQEYGFYGFRTVWEEGTGGASIEWKILKDDGVTEVLLNDVANASPAAFRRATGLPTAINKVSPLPGATGVPRNTAISASIFEGASAVTLNTVRLLLDGSQVTATPVKVGNVITISNQPPALLTATQHTATLSYTAGGIARTQSWNFTVQGTTIQPQLLWMVGRDDDAHPAGNGGGPNASFVQENGAINPLPGVPNSPEVNQQADNDYYFAGSFATVIPSVTALYGNYAPVGTVAVNEEAAERAFAAGDLDLRYHFNLPAILQPTDLLTVTFDANSLDTNPGDGTVPPPTDPRFGVEVYFNGVLVQPQILIRPAQLGVDYTTPQFSLASVNAQVGLGPDNIVSLKGISYLADGGGNWMGIDYVQLNASPGAARPVFLPPVVSGGQIRLNWTGGGALEWAPTVLGPWTPVSPVPAPPYPEAIVSSTNRFFRLRQQ